VFILYLQYLIIDNLLKETHYPTKYLNYLYEHTPYQIRINNLSYARLYFQSGIFAFFLRIHSQVWQFGNFHRSSGERGTGESLPERG